VRGQERILREQFAQAACVQCGAAHQPDDMLVLAQRGSRWLVLLTCRNCKRRGIFVASFDHPAPPRQPLDDLDALDTQLGASQTHISPARSQPWPLTSSASVSDDPSDILNSHARHHLADAPVTSGDVENIRHFLNGFDGDFRALFGPAGE
jgi:hypothetical protein